jgi:hypothetical protein
MRSSVLVRVATVVGALTLVPAAAYASIGQGAVVSSNASDSTPQLVATSAKPRPNVDAIASAGATTVMGGEFDTVSDGTRSYAGLSSIAAFDTATGQVSTAFKPTLASGASWHVWDLEMGANNTVYVAGDFTSVNGVARAGLVKLDLTTGKADPTFNPYFKSGRVRDLLLTNVGGKQRLLIAGSMSNKIASVDPTTGKNDGYIDTVVADPIAGAWGGLAVYKIAVDPSGTHLAATGNFQTVDGAPRRHFFMLDLRNAAAPNDGTTLSSWYYPGFAKDCSSTAARRIAYLQGVDWSPDGAHLSVTATGQIPKDRPADIWYPSLGNSNKPNTTVCDAVGRFALADPTKPEWINYTGGDSIWTVADTGAAVYIEGHFKYVDNPDGYASLNIGEKATCPTFDPKTNTGGCATRRAGVAAINPVTGKAIETWSPAAPTKTGGKAILPVSNGVWFGSDSTNFGAEKHYGIAFAPLR